MLNLAMPDPMSQDLFSEQVVIIDVARVDHGEADTRYSDLGITKFHWPLSEPQNVSRADLNLLRPVFRKIRFLKQAGFGIVSAQFPEPDQTALEAQIAFEAAGTSHDGRPLVVKLSLMLRWEQVAQPSEDADKQPAAVNFGQSWQITEWRVQRLDTMVSERPLFTDVP